MAPSSRLLPAVVSMVLAGWALAWPTGPDRARGAGAAGRTAATPAPGRVTAAEPFLYIPPDLAEDVVFYHSFSAAADRPEINLLGAEVAAAPAGRAAGLTGSGYRPADRNAVLRLHGLKLPLTRPLTVGLWWRLDAPMKPETCFHLVSLRGRGYISHFVRGRGQWCALTEPTFVVQVYRFPGISNINGLRGSAWVDRGVWHHAAVTVSEGSRVCVYWDGRLRSESVVKGRPFGADDAAGTVEVGPHWLRHPMTIDEVLVLDRCLSPGDLRGYVTAVGKLAAIGFPFRRP